MGPTLEGLLAAASYVLILANVAGSILGIYSCSLLLEQRLRPSVRWARLCFLWNLVAVAAIVELSVPAPQACLFLLLFLCSQVLAAVGFLQELRRRIRLMVYGDPLHEEEIEPVAAEPDFSGLLEEGHVGERVGLLLGWLGPRLRSWRRRAWDGLAEITVTRAAPRPLHVVAMINGYGVQDASALDILAHLRQRHGAQVRVVAPEDGPLRERARERGLEAVVEPCARLAGGSADDCVARLSRLGLGAGDDIVIGGSLAASIAVPLAAKRGIPSLLYVQECLPVDEIVASLFAAHDARQARYVVLGALHEATRVCFTEETTLAFFKSHDRGHFRAIPDAIDADATVASARGASRAEIRRRHHVPEEAAVVLCVGTVCHRKGQRVLVEALGRMRRRPPELQCLLVGLRDTPELAMDVEGVRALVERQGLKEIVRFVPETDAREFFAMADVYVCPSLNESLPRTVLEAMAFGLPIVAARTAGVAGQLDEASAWLCEPADPDALSVALESSLHDRDEGARRGAMAGARVREVFSGGPGLERHAELVFETAGVGRAGVAMPA